MKSKEVSLFYQYLVFKNILNKVVEDNQAQIELPNEEATEQIMEEAEEKISSADGKTRKAIRYEYMYTVMKDTLTEILKNNEDKELKLPTEKDLQDIHQQVVEELQEFAPKSAKIANTLKL